MELYFGGAYNGKLKFVKERFDILEKDIFYCNSSDIDFSKKVINGIHVFVYNCLKEGKNPIEYIEENLKYLEKSIVICDDLSSGIVPLKKDDRKWREETGKLLQFLSDNSNKVTRIFCGIPQTLKG